VSIRRSLGWLQYYSRQYEAALENLRRALTMDPTAEETHRLLALVYLQQGRYDDSAAAFRESIANSKNAVLAIAGLGHVAARRGRPEEARKVLAELQERARNGYVSPVAMVGLHVALGETEAAFEGLERAYRERRGWLAYLRIEPLLEPVRGDPRFHRLLERMRLA
jgi:serine/threonine-protein kinase